MPNAQVLTIAFLERHPGPSARVLAEMNYEAAAAFLDSLPTRVSEKVFSNMGASSAANILGHMTPVNAAAIFRTQDYLLSTTILRLIPMAIREGILKQIPQKLKCDLEQSLSFPPDTVGARMTTSVIMLSNTATVEDAKRELRQSPHALADFVFIVGDDRRLSGIVHSVLLFRHTEHVKLITLMEKDIPTLSARSKLQSIYDAKIWDAFGALPVVSRKKHLIGALRRETKSQPTLVITSAGASATPVIISLIELFLASMTGLIHILASTDKPVEPVKNRET
jgi:Mg/Co/Ni transporter MgtE